MDFQDTDVPADASIRLDDMPEISRRFRLQFERAQSAWVLLYPEGMVRLSESAGEIMKRIDGATRVGMLIRELEAAFPGAALRQDVLDFLAVARERGWIHDRQ